MSDVYKRHTCEFCLYKDNCTMLRAKTPCKKCKHYLMCAHGSRAATPDTYEDCHDTIDVWKQFMPSSCALVHQLLLEFAKDAKTKRFTQIKASAVPFDEYNENGYTCCPRCLSKRIYARFNYRVIKQLLKHLATEIVVECQTCGICITTSIV